MKSQADRVLAVVLVCLFTLLIGCKEPSQTVTATTATKAVSSTAVPVATKTVAAVPPTSTAASGDQHDDLSPMGLPLYPNVVDSTWTDTEAIRPLVGKPKLDTPRMRNGELSTKDSFEVVYAWYQKRMPAGSETASAAASNHTNTDGDRTALFEAGKDGDPTYQRVMILRGKNDEYTLVNLTGRVSK